MKKLLTLAIILGSVTGQAYAETSNDSVSAPVFVETAHSVVAHAELLGKDASTIGKVELLQGTIGALLRLDVNNLPAGWHGFHIHATGTCDHEGHFKSAHGHIDPAEKEHGYLNAQGPELGDLPNLYIHADGTQKLELFLPQLDVSQMMDEDGSAFVIHENPDDHMTQPIGGAGPRIACGVVKLRDAGTDKPAE